MKGINPKNILPLARKDVEMIKKEARFVLKIDGDGNFLSCKGNNNGKIWSIAVIGPAFLIKEEVKKALQKADLLEEAFFEKELLLLEVGFRRGKPYQRGFNKEGGKHKRRKWFYLSKKQYSRVSLHLFWFLKYLCQETRDNKWEKNKKPFIKNGKRNSFRRLGMGIISSGTRYSISMEDIYAVADVFWAEKNLNSVQKKFVSWLGNALVNVLSRQRNKRKQKECVEEWIYDLPLYLLERAAKEVRNQFAKVNLLNLIYEVKRKDKSKNRELDREAVEIFMASVLSNPEERLRNIQVRIRRIKRNCLIFEVYPEYSLNLEDYTFSGGINTNKPEEKPDDQFPF